MIHEQKIEKPTLFNEYINQNYSLETGIWIVFPDAFCHWTAAIRMCARVLHFIVLQIFQMMCHERRMEDKVQETESARITYCEISFSHYVHGLNFRIGLVPKRIQRKLIQCRETQTYVPFSMCECGILQFKDVSNFADIRCELSTVYVFSSSYIHLH